MTLVMPSTATAHDRILFFSGSTRAPVVRTMERWVEDEIRLVNGPFAGEMYRHLRHPVSRLWFHEIDSGHWSRFAATGPTQNGKTLICYTCPVLYHVFEIGETAIVGLPSMDMANDKWQQDFLPVIEASNYRDLLPLKGEGSRGGQVKRAIVFRNGAVLRFMTAGGSDKKRAGYTSRVVAITETDGMDEAGESSREADKIEQIEGRTRAFGRTGKRIYLECTVSIEAGRIWQEVKRGSDSRIARPCPHCGVYVTPEREHLVGWQSAESEEAAAAAASWACPSCGEFWTEAQRHEAAAASVLVHRGQQVDAAGLVTGEVPQTQTLGFRWSAIDNPFVTAADLGAEEWTAARSKDRENAEKKMRQFVWSVPYEPPDIDLTPLDPDEIAARRTGFKRGIVPDDCLGIGIGVDTGKRKLHWDAKALRADGSMAVIEYGTQTVEADRLGVLRGLLEAFRKLRTYFDKGWSMQGGRTLVPSQVWIDSGYHEHTDAVYQICAEANQGLPLGGERYRPTKGYGEAQRTIGRYLAPTARSQDVRFMGKEYHIARVRRSGKVVPGVLLVHLNADHWKSEMHQRLSIPCDHVDAEGAFVPGSPGNIALFEPADPIEHADYVQQLTAERQMEKLITGRGLVAVWERIRRENHYGDAGYASTAACDFIFTLTQKAAAPSVSRPSLAALAAKANRT